MENFSDRLEHLLAFLAENKTSFSKKIGMSNNVTIGRIINENRAPSFEVLLKISNAYPEVNLNWLITGKENIIKHSYDDLQNFKKDDIISYLIMYVEDFKNNPKLDALYRILKSVNNQESLENMHEKIDELTKIVEELKKK